MVIRNPYNFIVKHFKLINLLLLLPMLYLALKTGDIASFFRDYVSAGYSTPETNFTETYITTLTTVATLITLIAHVIVFVVLATKKKNSIYHLVGSIYYIIVLICLFFFTASMKSIEAYSMDATFANFVRDTASLVSIPGYVLLAWGAITALGFNLKTFRFDGHHELKVSDDDEDDDIEIKVGSDENALKRSGVHLFREMKYYVLENKFVFSCIAVVLLFIVGYTWYSEYQIYNKSYTINQSFSLENFSLSIKESYITNVDYRGALVSDEKYYLAVKIGIHNEGPETTIDRSNFRIYIGDQVIYPSYDKSSRFIDIGRQYQGEIIHTNESDDFVFVYELTDKQLKSNYEMRILSGLTQKNEELLTKYKKINIRPSNILKTKELGETKLNKNVDFSETTLGKTTFTLKKISVVQNYEFKYDSCDSKNNCKEVRDLIIPSGGNVLVIIEDDLVLDQNSPYYKNSERDFYGDFVTLDYKYVLGQFGASEIKKNKTKLTNVTPKLLKNQSIYEAPGTLLYATDIEMKIQIRNQILIIEAK